MSIRLQSINVNMLDDNIAGTLVLLDDEGPQNVEVNVLPIPTPPGYIVSLRKRPDPPDSWNVFAFEADRILRTLTLTAEEAVRRENAVRAVVQSHRLEGFEEDLEMEALMWRYARGEITFDEFEERALTDPAPPAEKGDPKGEAP